MAYVKPVRPGMVVAADKVAKFTAQKPNSAEKEKRKRLVADFRANNAKVKSYR